MLRIERLGDVKAELGEGPLWDVAEQRLYWIDSLGSLVHACDADGGNARTWSVPEHIGSLALRQGGGAILALRDGFYSFDFGTGSANKLADPDPGKPRIRLNDGKVDRQGRFVAGYMDYEERDPICSVFRLDPGGAVERLDDGIVCSNGPCWSPDGRIFYFADTYTRDIWAYDYGLSTGRATNRRVFASFPAAGLKGLPDGATVDAEGHYWVAMFEGAQLLRFAPSGEIVASVSVPVQCPTMPCFGGDDLKTLFVTSGRKGRPAAEIERLPASGTVISMRVDTPGLPVNFFED